MSGANHLKNDGGCLKRLDHLPPALIYLSYITRKMQINNLFKYYTLQEVLDDLDMIECFEVPGQKLQVSEITKHQVDLFHKLGVIPPASLQ